MQLLLDTSNTLSFNFSSFPKTTACLARKKTFAPTPAGIVSALSRINRSMKSVMGEMGLSSDT